MSFFVSSKHFLTNHYTIQVSNPAMVGPFECRLGVQPSSGRHRRAASTSRKLHSMDK